MPDNLIENRSFNERIASDSAPRARTLKQQHIQLFAAISRAVNGVRRSGTLPEGLALPPLDRNGSPMVEIQMRMEV